MNRGATITPSLSKQIVTSSKYRVAYISGGAMFPAWSPTRWTCCAGTGKIESSLPLPGSSASVSAPCGRGRAGRRLSARGVGRSIFKRVPQWNIWDQSILLLCTHFLFRSTIVGAINANPSQGVVLLDEKKQPTSQQNPGRVQTSGVVLCRRGFTGAAGTDQSHSS